MVKYVLSLDSGGIRSTIQVFYLYYLEQDLLKHYGKTIYEVFDFYAGTSGGAMVIGALLYTDTRTLGGVIEKFFNEVTMKEIFKRSLSSYLLGGITRPKYDTTNKTKILKENMGSKSIRDTDKDVMITAYSITSKKPRFIKSYERRKDHVDTPIVEAIDASSAAPGYFPNIKFTYRNNVEEYGTDGAIFASDPTDCAYADVLNLYGHEEDIRILSIGTGTGTDKYKSYGKESASWGLYQWVTKGSIISKLLDTDMDTTHYRMKQYSKVLGHRYVRIQGQTDIVMDDVGSMEDLKSIAKDWYLRTRDELFSGFFDL